MEKFQFEEMLGKLIDSKERTEGLFAPLNRGRTCVGRKRSPEKIKGGLTGVQTKLS